jgi:hypothetical protein
MKIINTFVISIVIMFSAKVYAVNCEQNPLYCKILSLQPALDKTWAMEFSNLVGKAAKRYNLDPYRIVAIANQESGLKNIDRCTNVIIFNEKNEQNHGLKEFSIKTACADIGIFQINVATIQEYEFDIWKLKESVSYQIESHCKVLRDKIKMCKSLGENAWTCYHSKTKDLREEYQRLVDRFY